MESFTPCPPLDFPELSSMDAGKKEKLLKAMEPFLLTDDAIARIRQVFADEMDLGLKYSLQKSSLQMENTFIPELPDGTENGDYLALDLGGTNFRVILLRMRNGAIAEEKVEYFHVPEETRLGRGEDLFDFLASCILEFVETEGLKNEKLPLGFCFSFPMRQEALDVGRLVNWTKSFNCSGVIGEDVVKMLNAALHKRGVDVDVIAVLNDTTGTLIAGAQADHNCAIGLILGTGCNACYLEKVSRLVNWSGGDEVSEVVVDTECGAFGDNGCIDFIKTPVDAAIDKESLLPSTFTFEKYFAGKYMGDIVRRILLQLATEHGFFGGFASAKLREFGKFTTTHVSGIEEETLSGGCTKAKEILNEFDLVFDADDVRALQYVCAAVTFRAAQLVSICTAYLLDRMKKPVVTIAVDGSVFKNHPRLKVLLDYFTAKYAPTREFKYMLSEDGSGKGAGVAAAIAKRLQDRKSDV